MKVTGIALTAPAVVSLAFREMRLTAILAMIVAAATTGEAGQPRKQHVIVFVRNDANVPQDVKNHAEELAASMFASVGVRIDWRNGEPSASSSHQALAIRLARKTPNMEKSGALAYAMPQEGVHIVVFWDRMEFGFMSTELLAHVMVHEITHILERVSRHSKSGIMRAQWTEEDQNIMKTHPLSFALEDVELIHRGLATRSASPHGIKMAAIPRSTVMSALGFMDADVGLIRHGLHGQTFEGATECH